MGDEMSNNQPADQASDDPICDNLQRPAYWEELRAHYRYLLDGVALQRAVHHDSSFFFGSLRDANSGAYALVAGELARLHFDAYEDLFKIRAALERLQHNAVAIEAMGAGLDALGAKP